MFGFQLLRLVVLFRCFEFIVRLGLRDFQEWGMLVGVYVEVIKGIFVVGEEWWKSKIKILQFVDILLGNLQFLVKMGYFRNIEYVACDCRGRVGRLENVLYFDLGVWFFKM